jgi:prevent-host-death family protein
MTMIMTMVIWRPDVRTIKAGEFKAKCLALLDEVAETGETIEITKRGKVVARLGPARDATDTLSESDIAAWYNVDSDDEGLNDLPTLTPARPTPRKKQR